MDMHVNRQARDRFPPSLAKRPRELLITEKARKSADDVLKAIERYAAVLVPLDISVQLSGVPFSSAGAVEGIASSFRSLTMGEDDVESCKRKVSEELSLAFENVVVVIDDIDRLPNGRICLLFQLVTQIADFPRVHYLLAYDADIVEKAISELQGASGRAYLEKIVQLPIDVPQIPQSVLRENVRSILWPTLSRYGVNEEGAEAMRAGEVIEYAVMPCVQTMRDCKRFLNAFEFENSFIGEGISVVDLIALVSIKQFYPEVSEWMDSHTSQLCGASASSFVPSEASKYKDATIKVISELLGDDDSRAQSVVEALISIFPRFACSCGTFSEKTTIQEMKMKGRVASEEVYARYSLASLASWGYPRETIRALLNDAPRNEITVALESGLADGSDLAQEAVGLVGSLSAERARMIAGVRIESKSHSPLQRIRTFICSFETK